MESLEVISSATATRIGHLGVRYRGYVWLGVVVLGIKVDVIQILLCGTDRLNVRMAWGDASCPGYIAVVRHMVFYIEPFCLDRPLR